MKSQDKTSIEKHGEKKKKTEKVEKKFKKNNKKKHEKTLGHKWAFHIGKISLKQQQKKTCI